MCVENAAEAAAFLANTEGSILLTTGSKELAAYSGILDFTQRVYARVLPMDASLEACRTAGLKASHIIAMQGLSPRRWIWPHCGLPTPRGW